jgi:hypothetical protein
VESWYGTCTVSRLIGRLNQALDATRLILLIWRLEARTMSDKTARLVDAFTAKLQARGVPVKREDNASRLQELEEQVTKRLPQSFQSLLSRYSFPTFDALGISFFGWGPASTELLGVASAIKGSLSELLLPAGYFQIGRPDTGSFDAICFDLNDGKQNREHGIVLADHEEILCNSRVRISSQVWPSFQKLLETAVKA